MLFATRHRRAAAASFVATVAFMMETDLAGLAVIMPVVGPFMAAMLPPELQAMVKK